MLEIDISVSEIMSLFSNRGYKIFIVGGAVRDLLLNRKVFDYDLATSAKPIVIEKLLKNYTLNTTGKYFGSYSFDLGKNKIQITTFRKETYNKLHYPNKTTFTTSLLEDLKRRDFTINTLAYYNGEIFDYYNGKMDLEKQVIRLIENKSTKFKEDPLRILRAIRFSLTLNFEIEEETYLEMLTNLHLLEKIKPQLIKKEIDKIDLKKFENNPLVKLIQPYINYKGEN